MSSVNTQELLERIRSDKVKPLDFQEDRRFLDLEHDVDVISLMHEIDVVRAPMLCLFMLNGYDINGKSIYHQTPDKILRRKLKEFLRQKQKLKENNDFSNEYLKISNKVRKTRETIKVLKIVRKLIADNDPCDSQPEIPEEKLCRTIPEEEKICSELACARSDKTLINPNMYMDIAKFVTDTWKRRRQERLYAKELLERSGCNRDKIEQIARNMSDETISLLHQNNDGAPKLLFHGGKKQSKTSFLPLSHCGTFRAAYDRLYDCVTDDRYFSSATQITPLYLKMKSPYRLPDYVSHDLEGYKMILSHILLTQSKGIDFCWEKCVQNRIKPVLCKMFLDFELPPEVDYIFNHPMRMDMKHVYDELVLRRVYSLDLSKDKETREKNNRERLIWSRFIHYFEKQGYDGFVYRNFHEDMMSDSYICFRQDQFLYVGDENIEEKIKTPAYKYRDEKRLATLEARQMKECSKTHLTKKKASEYVAYFEDFITEAKQYNLYDKQEKSVSNFGDFVTEAQQYNLYDKQEKCVSNGTKCGCMSMFFDKIRTLCRG